MSKEHGNLSINSQNIFPIIKKWMYSDHDIFYRELVSNACDAITKLKKLSMIGEYEAPDDIEYKVEIKLSAKDKTIKIIDNGIGMTKEEVMSISTRLLFQVLKHSLRSIRIRLTMTRLSVTSDLVSTQHLW